MTKRLIDIDDDLLNEVREALGAATWKETVNRALAETAALRRRRSLIEHLTTLRGLDLADPEIMAGAWR